MPFTMSGVSVEASILAGGAVLDLDATVKDQKGPVRAMLQSISEITIQVGMSQLSELTITMTPTYEDAIKILRSGLLGIGFVPEDASGATNAMPALQMRIGYDGGEDTMNRSPWFYGGLTVPSLDLGEEITLTMHAHSGIYYAARLDTHVSKLMSGNDLLQMIADKFNLTITILDGADKILSAPPEPIVVYGDLFTTMRDFCYRKRLNFYYAASADSDEASDNMIVSSRKTDSDKTPSWQFVMFEQISPGEKIIPIIRYHVDATALALPGAAWGGKALGTDTKTKKSITPEEATTNASDVDSSFAPQGGTAASDEYPTSDKDTGKGGGAKTFDPATDAGRKSSQLIRDNVSTAEMESAKIAQNIENTLEFTVEVPGLPGLLANDLVEVRIGGLKELSGVAWVTGLTHRIGSEFVTEVHLSRALGVAAAEASGLIVNTQSADVKKPVKVIKPKAVAL